MDIVIHNRSIVNIDIDIHGIMYNNRVVDIIVHISGIMHNRCVMYKNGVADNYCVMVGDGIGYKRKVRREKCISVDGQHTRIGRVAIAPMGKEVACVGCSNYSSGWFCTGGLCDHRCCSHRHVNRRYTYRGIQLSYKVVKVVPTCRV